MNMRRALSICCACTVLSVSFASQADEGDAVALPASVSVRRSGFDIGLTAGLQLSAAHGFPNDVNKIGVAQYRASTGLGVSRGGVLWLGGSIVDWFSLGVGIAGTSNTGRGTKSTGGSFQVRVETFPLFYQSRVGQDLGLLFCAGLGGYQIERGGEKIADGGATSALGFGAFYEPWRLWHFSFGPQLEYQEQFSHTINVQTVTLSLRSVFYGGP
jgi:hypothetical protein